jgi:hypothetical protein
MSATASTTTPTKLPAWEDASIYQWTFRNTKKDVAGFIGFLVGAALVFPALIYGFFWLVSFLSTTVAFWFAFAVTCLFLVVYIYHVGVLWSGKKTQQIEARGTGPWIAIATIGALSYAMSAHGSFIAPSFTFDGGEKGSGMDATPWQWCLFWVDNTMSVVLLDIPEVFELHISTLTYSGFWSRLTTVIMRVLIVAGFIEAFFMCYRSTFMEEQFHGTMQECYWKCEGLPSADEVEVILDGKVELLGRSERIIAQEIIRVFKPTAKEASA